MCPLRILSECNVQTLCSMYRILSECNVQTLCSMYRILSECNVQISCSMYRILSICNIAQHTICCFQMLSISNDQICIIAHLRIISEYNVQRLLSDCNVQILCLTYNMPVENAFRMQCANLVFNLRNTFNMQCLRILLEHPVPVIREYFHSGM